MEYDVFISYSRHDELKMIQVRDMLQKSGLRVWTDKGIEIGTTSWKQSISSAIINCSCIVVLFSPEASQSMWVSRELDFAELHKKNIYPLLVSGEPENAIPFGYTTYQFVDLRNESEAVDGIAKLIEAIQENLGEEQEAVQPTSASPIPASTETLWKWVELPDVNFTLPSTWKLTEPTEENWWHTQLLLSGDEKRFFRWIQDEPDLMRRLTGIPGLQMKMYKVLSDISELTPIIGFMAWQQLPFPTHRRMARIGASLIQNRFGKFIAERYDSEFTGSYWLERSDKSILALDIETKRGDSVDHGRAYTIFPTLSNRALTIFLGCEAHRFKAETALYDHLVRSVQFG